MSRSAAPVSFARSLVADVLSGYSPTKHALNEAAAFVQVRRDERGEPPGRKGHELVVERLLRPVLTGWAATKLGLTDIDVPLRINSSHFHTCDDAEWPKSWRTFQQTHRNVDTYDKQGHLRRADLFICPGGRDIVSIEFKYVQQKRVPAPEPCARQMRQYLRVHKASILVIYAATPASPRLETTIRRIRRNIGSARAFVATLAGPSIEFPAASVTAARTTL